MMAILKRPLTKEEKQKLLITLGAAAFSALMFALGHRVGRKSIIPPVGQMKLLFNDPIYTLAAERDEKISQIIKNALIEIYKIP